MISSVINEDGVPVEVAPGRGNLRHGSIPYVLNLRRSLRLIDRQVSFARIYASQPLLAATIGWLVRQSKRVPLKMYRRTGDDSRVQVRPPEHPLAAGIVNPWERGSQVDLVSFLLGSFLIHGNTVSDIDQGAKNSIRFGTPDWRYLIPIMPWRDTIAGWELDRDDPTLRRMVGADTVLHIRDYSPLGPLGISPLEQLGVTIAIEDAAHRHQRAMLRNGARPPSAIEAVADFLGLKPEERKELLDNLREDIDELYAGPENSGRPALLPPGLTWKQVGHTAVEAELIAQREVSRQEAVSLFGLTPAAMGVISRGSPEIDVQRQMAVTDGLAPPLILIESCINAQVVTGLLHEDDVFVEFDFAGILRGDKLKEIEAIRDAIATAVMTPNEGQAIMNKPRSDKPGMDDFYLPRNNLIPVDVAYTAKGMGGGGTSEGTPEEGGTAGTADEPGDTDAEPTTDPAGHESSAALV